MFEKPEELSQHLKPLYVRGHIDGRSISRMLVDDSLTSTSCRIPCSRSLGEKIASS
jgi:hypothetical protein